MAPTPIQSLALILFGSVAFATTMNWRRNATRNANGNVMIHPVLLFVILFAKDQNTPCAKCTIHCERPICSVRCPKDMCEEEGCPKCETVCSPAKCHTKCVAPEPKCNPVCEETQCDWKCRKPTTCPKPKCELQCEKPECATTPKCCECSAAGNAAAAVVAAGTPSGDGSQMPLPSFLEVLNTIRHNKKNGDSMCCPCKE
eukprot:jgi/Bigna1/130968/aug1.13_g5676